MIARFSEPNHIDSIAVSVNHQVGLLSPPIITGTNYGPSLETCKFECVDFTGNGEVDILISRGVGDIEMFSGTGSGSFDPCTLMSGKYGAKALDTGDINSDGDLDIVVLNNGYISALLNDGSSNLTLGGEYGYLLDDQVIGALELVDTNQDGNLDVVTAPGAGMGSTSVFSFIGYGAGVFTQVEPGWFHYGTTFCHLTIDDVNMDENPDAFLHGTGNHLLLLGNGMGGFTEDYYTLPKYCSESAVARPHPKTHYRKEADPAPWP